MKAVEFSYSEYKGSGFVPIEDFAGMEPSLRYGVVGSGFVLSIRYDNGQLCTFRRKTKGQDNER